MHLTGTTLLKKQQLLKSITKKSLAKFQGYPMKVMLPHQSTHQYIRKKMNSEESKEKSVA